MNSAVVFDAERHTYTLGGVVLPSVTRVLRSAGLLPPIPGDTAAALDRGHVVHAACAILDEMGGLDWTSVPEEWHGYIRAWQRWSEEHEAEWSAVEKPLADGVRQFAGTPDRVGIVGGLVAVVDIKTGAENRWHSWQTAGYSLLVGEAGCYRLSVYLGADGRYRVREHRDANDRRIFLAALTCYHAGKGE